MDATRPHGGYHMAKKYKNKKTRISKPHFIVVKEIYLRGVDGNESSKIKKNFKPS